MSRPRLGRKPRKVVQISLPGEIVEEIEKECEVVGKKPTEVGRHLFTWWLRLRRAKGKRNKKRAFYAPPDGLRCMADRKPLKDGSAARCMRTRMLYQRFCHTHLKASSAFWCDQCGTGSDDYPGHTVDCMHMRV